MPLEWIATLGNGFPGFGQDVFLVSLRVGTLLLLTPILFAAPLPPSARALLVIGLSAGLALGLSHPPLAVPTFGAFLQAAAQELALGAVLGLGVLIAFATVSAAGRLIDLQIGFGMAQVFDPVTRRQIPVVTSAFDHLAILVFFLVNGHHALLRGVAYTLERFPPGRPWSLEHAAPMVAKQMGGIFSLGFALAAPVIACLLLLELAMGVVARNLPQINMFVLGMPMKVVVGLAVLSLWLAGMGDAMTRVYAFIYRSWDAAFGAMPGGVR